MDSPSNKTKPVKQFQDRRRRRTLGGNKRKPVVLQSVMERRSRLMTRVVLWGLVVVFGLTSIAVFVGGKGQRGMPDTQTQNQNQAQTDAQRELKYAQENAAKSPQDPFSWSRLGDLYEQQKDYKEAAKDFKRAVDLDPTFVYARKHLGRVTLLLDKPQEAMVIFNQALKQAPKDQQPEILFYLSVASIQLKDKDKAVEYANRSLDLDPGNLRVHEWLGQLYMQLGKRKDAQRVFSEALEIAQAQGDSLRMQVYQQVLDKLAGKAPKPAPEAAASGPQAPVPVPVAPARSTSDLPATSFPTPAASQSGSIPPASTSPPASPEAGR